MPVQDKNISKRASSAREYIVFHFVGTVAASIAGAGGIKWGGVGNGIVERIQLRTRAKANNDNTLTVTAKINGTAITGGAPAFVAGAAPQYVEASPTALNTLKPDDLLTYDTGALGGTTPAFTDLQVVFVVRTGGPDITLDIE